MCKILHINKSDARLTCCYFANWISIQLILTYKEDKSRGFLLDLLLREVKVIAKNYALRILCVHQRQKDSTLLISNCKLNVTFDRTQVVFPSLKQGLTLVSFITTLEFWYIFLLLISFPVL